MRCKSCKQAEAAVSGVVKGEYVSNVCRDCFQSKLTDQRISSGHADYMRSRDVEDHEADIVQPYTKDGTPAPQFIQLYPERAMKMFSEQELRRYGL